MVEHWRTFKDQSYHGFRQQWDKLRGLSYIGLIILKNWLLLLIELAVSPFISFYHWLTSGECCLGRLEEPE